jgi:hypothetical protein
MVALDGNWTWYGLTLNTYFDCSHPDVYIKVLNMYRVQSNAKFIFVNYAYSEMFRLQRVIIRLPT